MHGRMEQSNKRQTEQREKKTVHTKKEISANPYYLYIIFIIILAGSLCNAVNSHTRSNNNITRSMHSLPQQLLLLHRPESVECNEKNIQIHSFQYNP